MQNKLDLVEGWTERIVVELSADGSVVNLTGMSVTLLLYSKNRAVALSGSSGLVSGGETEGKVYFDPSANDLKASESPYSARWKVTDGNGKSAMFPNDLPDTWIVRLP